MERRSHILFLSSGLYGLELMAEGLTRLMDDGRTETVSTQAGKAGLHLTAIKVMAEVGVDLKALHQRRPSNVEPFAFDMAVAIGPLDPGLRLNLPGMPPLYRWEPPPEIREGLAANSEEAFRQAREWLREKIRLIFASQMLDGLSVGRRNLELVLDSLAHAVMAHSMNRRIFFFNQAAEEITGWDREDVLGRDCHDVFKPSRFCGGDCSFCEGRGDAFGRREQKHCLVDFERPDAVRRRLEMTVMPLSDCQGTSVGALVSFRDVTELERLRREMKVGLGLHGLLGRHPRMQAVFELIREVSPHNIPVLIDGESGTGKELAARAIHLESPRADKPFVAVNCGALPDGILESELFGHTRGAFTGAVRDQKGRFELANGGTLFLDEIGELPHNMQVKLLRALQEHQFERLGDGKLITVDVRVISATNRNLHKLMEKGLFRADLFYRLCVAPLTLPPLRDRLLDVPLLTEHFLDLAAQVSGKPRPSLADETLEILMRSPWPGNVRELRNAIEYACVKCRMGLILPEHLPPELAGASRNTTPTRGAPPKLNREMVVEALAQAGGNRSRAAKLLGVGRTTLYRFLDGHEVK